MKYFAQLDLSGEESPIPMIRTKELLDLANTGDTIKVTVSKESAVRNIATLVSNNPYEIIESVKTQSHHVLYIRKL